jgi:chromosomal replication initiation ATPase DnaA
VIDGFTTQVRQVAAAFTKRGKEILVVNLGVGDLKGRTHGSIQTGVRRIEKSSGSRRRLPDKQQLNT